MDYFGTGSAFKGMARVYFQSARKTGRTVSMLDHLKDGDRIVFSNAREADRVRRLFKEDKKDVICIVVDPKTPERLFEYGTNQGRTIFNHTWVEEYYFSAIERCEKDIDYFQNELSGWGEPHRETRRKHEEMIKWNVG